MRVRVLRVFIRKGVLLRAGDIVEIDPKAEAHLLRTCLVMEDKSLDGAKETKQWQ